ncbi:hypothetical protein BLNAU_16200 [Blattamonas nauphoetae]|uniref:Uncharacterized protein n=1 Tax=Blattamonas nauphoetae TaxID=2049346 RepID=A0ABQ9XC44_9EUKA|nr:hypothetical protein BLNAU_16200 [Blattamonas nauphoetae]
MSVLTVESSSPSTAHDGIGEEVVDVLAKDRSKFGVVGERRREEAIGWPDTVKFDTSYPVVSVVRKSSPIFSIPCTGLVLSTGSQPDPLTVFANDSSHQNPKLCGNSARPCSSVDVAWMIVNAYSVQTIVLKIVTKVSLSSSIVIESGQVASFEKHAVPPTLVIPSTASHDDSPGLVSVAGTLTIDKVSIVVQTDDLSFVLFDVNGGELVLDSVHISGVPSSSDLVDDADELCSWETGLIKLHDATMSTHSCEFSSIGMGEIWMESSNLSLKSTQILSNGPRFTRFPSAQQDVMCKSGNITILPSASDMIEDHWISSLMECSVLLNGSELKSPHFVASLDVKNSTSTQSKQKDSFSVVLVGSKLIPCGLSLEVSESSSSQSSKANKPASIALSLSSVESWNETHIALSVASSSLSSLSSDAKWDACLVYGHDLRTSSFTFLPSLRDRKALTLQKTLPWLIPVIVWGTTITHPLFCLQRIPNPFLNIVQEQQNRQYQHIILIQIDLKISIFIVRQGSSACQINFKLGVDLDLYRQSDQRLPKL